MSSLEYIWEKSVQVFPILNKNFKETNCSMEDVLFITDELHRLKMLDDIYCIIMNNIDYVMRHQTVPKFWSYFQVSESDESGFYQFQLAICELHKECEKYYKILRRMQPLIERRGKSEFIDVYREFNDLLKVDLLSQLPSHFNEIVYSFYQTSFQVFANSHQDDDDDAMDEIQCNGCGKETDHCRCQELVVAFNKTNQNLYELNLLDRLAGNTLTNLIQDRIISHVQDTCKGIFDISHLQSLSEWLDTIVLNWLTRIYNQGSAKIDPIHERTHGLLREFRIKLEYFLYETYANNIIEQFFNIIIDFPESLPAVVDLKKCMEKLDLKLKLVKSLKESLEKRLLHPGVNTSDILTGYVAAIKTIRALDSSGVLLESITEPVKRYMRSRQDTVRCVATALTDDGPTDLAEELAASESYVEVTNNNDQMANWETWCPDPIDTNTIKPRQTTKSADIISMVIDIYGTKEVFVNEYRTLLADRLLTQLDFNPEKELRNLELLKLRFGETMLHTCEVMLKDIGDSKRINANVVNESTPSENGFDLSTLILSSQFWPAFKNDALELPTGIKETFEKFTKSYETYKGNRTLLWRPFIGRVEIDIEIGDKTFNMTVSPVHAVIIHEFQHQNSWHMEDLSHHIKVPSTVLRKRLMFWIAQGFIRESAPNYFTLIHENPSESKREHDDDCEDDDENESAMASADEQREEELQVFWSYIVGMLTNLDSLPLERIHQMLKMFASHGPGVEFSQEELKHFLQRKVREHALVFAGGVYHLPK